MPAGSTHVYSLPDTGEAMEGSMQDAEQEAAVPDDAATRRANEAIAAERLRQLQAVAIDATSVGNVMPPSSRYGQ